ncbi:MAG: hypothetical protein RL522_2181 [Pseudomonadota bacterium]|jgi:uncharacterized SAM-binding protein YcdF (DUF218 family)
MQWGDIKALVAPLVLPPAGPLLLVLVALIALALWPKRRQAVLPVAFAGVAALWALSCHAIAIWLAGALLPLPQPLADRALPDAGTQAVVVLGGGVLAEAPEYGAAQPASATLARLRYGIRLARAQRLPLAFAGGLGWGGRGDASEAQAVAQSAREDFGFEPRWLDDQSRETRENAQKLAALMLPQGMRRIALVSDAWHLPRAALEFERAGFTVLPAPTRLPLPAARPALEWLPSSEGLTLSRHVLREWLALRAAHLAGR